MSKFLKAGDTLVRLSEINYVERIGASIVIWLGAHCTTARLDYADEVSAIQAFQRLTEGLEQ